MKIKDIRKLDDEALGLELRSLRNELFKLRTQTVSEKVEDTSRFSKLRKDVARLLTERNARLAAAAGHNG